MVIVLGSERITIQNISLSEDGRKIEWTNGAMSRYPKIVNFRLQSSSACTVIYKTDTGFILSDYIGSRKEISEELAVKYAKENGISNGKVISKDGKEYISSINGEYNYRGSYTGDKLNIKPLKPLVIENGIKYDYVYYCVTKYKDGVIKHSATRVVDMYWVPEFDTELMELGKYTLAYKHLVHVRLDTDEDIVNFVNKYSSKFNYSIQLLARRDHMTNNNRELLFIIGDADYTVSTVKKQTNRL